MVSCLGILLLFATRTAMTQKISIHNLFQIINLQPLTVADKTYYNNTWLPRVCKVWARSITSTIMNKGQLICRKEIWDNVSRACCMFFFQQLIAVYKLLLLIISLLLAAGSWFCCYFIILYIRFKILCISVMRGRYERIDIKGLHNIITCLNSFCAHFIKLNLNNELCIWTTIWNQITQCFGR